FGYVLYGWHKTHQDLMKQYDTVRMQKYDLVYEQAQLNYENLHIEQQARNQERQAIAEVLHDNLGHDLSGASLSLKAYRMLLEHGDLEDADKHLVIAEKKVYQSIEALKDAVKAIEPVNHQLNEQLFKMIEDFIYPIDFEVIG